MSYTKTNWQNLPNQTTPVNATNLNKIEQGIYDNDQAIQTKATLEDIQDNLVNVSNEVDEDYRVNVLKSNNLFNKDNIDGYVGLNATLTTTSNGVRATATTTGQYLQAIVIIKDATNMVGESVSIKGNFTASSSNTGRITIGLCDSAGGNRNGLVHITTSGNSGNATIPSISGDAKYLFIAFYANNDGTGATNSYVDYTNVMLNLGSTALPYEVFIPNQIVVDNEKYSDTINVGSVVDSRSRVNVLKGKNLINCNDFTSYSTTGVNVTTSKTNGLLDYINATKSSSISSNIFISICNFTLSKETGTYSLSGCPSGGGESTYQLYLKDETTTQDVFPRNDGTPVNVSLTKGHNYTLYLRLNASATFTDKKFYPMLLPTTETDTSYEPYITPSIYVDNEEIYSKPVVLWTNSSPKSNFVGQTITLNDDINNYTWYEIIFSYDANDIYNISSGRIPTNRQTILNLASNYLYRRVVNSVSGNTITFGDGQYYQTLGTPTTGHNFMIPLQVLGYK